MIPSFENYFIVMKPKAPHPKGKNSASRNAQIGKVLIKAIQSKPGLNVCAIENILSKWGWEGIPENLSINTVLERMGYSFKSLKANGAGGGGINPSLGEHRSDRYALVETLPQDALNFRKRS